MATPWGSDGDGAYDFDVEPGDRLSPLRELVYHCRLWQGPQSLIPSSFWDWSKICHLEVWGPKLVDFLDGIRGQIKCLETLKVENSCCETSQNFTHVTQVLNDFVSEIHGLASLELMNRALITFPLSVFIRQGSTLRKLCYHRPRGPWSLWQLDSAPLFSIEERR